MNLEMATTAETQVTAATTFTPPPRLPWATLSFFARAALQLCLIALLAYGSFLLISRYVMQSVQVIGASMSPTLKHSDYYLLNRLVYQFREPAPSEIVVLRDPTDSSFAVKRIIAREGDSVYLKGGRVYLNGQVLVEPYLPPRTQTFANPMVKEQFFVCGKGQYFVLGDNRNNSADSRTFGAVSRQDILGVIVR